MSLGSTARIPVPPGLNQQHEEELTDSAGDSVGFTDVAFLSSRFLWVPLCGSQCGREGAGVPRDTLSLKLLISWELLAELMYHIVGKISQVWGLWAFLEPISMTWRNGVVRLPRPGSQAYGGGTTERVPSLQHGTRSR